MERVGKMDQNQKIKHIITELKDQDLNPEHIKDEEYPRIAVELKINEDKKMSMVKLSLINLCKKYKLEITDYLISTSMVMGRRSVAIIYKIKD